MFCPFLSSVRLHRPTYASHHGLQTKQSIDRESGLNENGQDIDIAGFVLHGRLHVSAIASIHGDRPITFLSREAE